MNYITVIIMQYGTLSSNSSIHKLVSADLRRNGRAWLTFMSMTNSCLMLDQVIRAYAGRLNCDMLVADA